MVQSFFGGDTGVSYDELQRRKKYADQMIMRGASRPARNVSEGINSAANSILGALLARKAGKEESAQREEFGTLFADLLGGGTSFNPSVGSRGAAPSSYGGGVPDTPSFGPTDTAYPVGDDGPVPNEQVAAGGTTFDMGRPDMSQYRDAIASIESAGRGDYGAVGPTDERMGRALGRYQIMEANIGPWSREALGREVTPEEFLRKPRLQDAIFDHKFGGYVNQFGPEGAAQAWFAGPGGVGKTDRRDVLGTSVGEYGQKFMQALGGPTVSTQGSYQAPQGFSNGFDPRLVQALSNPYATDGQRAVLSALLQRQMAANQPMSPMEQLQFQKAQLELEQMRNPTKEPIEVGGVLVDPETYEPVFDSRQQNEGGFTLSPGQQRFDAQGNPIASAAPQGGPRPMTAQERKQWGIPENDTRPYAMTESGPKVIGGNGVTVNNNMGGGKFEEEFAKGDAQTLVGVSDAGLSAQRNLGRIDQLEGLLANSPTGFSAVAKQAAGEWGINTEGLSDIQAAQALINSMVPEQRPPGSGPMSDADLALFKQSLPRIINQPGGNQAIIGTMRAIAEYDAQGAQIVQRLRAGEISRADAFRELRSRADPLSGVRQGLGEGATPETPQPAQDGQPPKISTREEYGQLPSGAKFIAPDGSVRTKP